MSKKINKSDTCNAQVWNDAMEYIAFFLPSIINESLVNGYVPIEWKISKVTPIQKIKHTKKVSEFRPINSMQTDEKIMEYVVKEQLIKYLEENSLLALHQSAFRCQHSCETTLNYVINELKECIDKDLEAIVIFLDLARAFETIDRNRLIKKMQNYGINDVELKWFMSYLQHRKQYTKYKNCQSETLEIPIGLPQGTQLSVFLFLMYINDIRQIAEEGKIILFADDTVLIVTDKNIENAKQKTNEYLKKIYEYTNENKLKLNAEKSKWMMIGNKIVKDKQNISIQIGGK